MIRSHNRKTTVFRIADKLTLKLGLYFYDWNFLTLGTSTSE